MTQPLVTAENLGKSFDMRKGIVERLLQGKTRTCRPSAMSASASAAARRWA